MLLQEPYGQDIVCLTVLPVTEMSIKVGCS